MNYIDLKQLLQQPYNRANWQAILREMFPNVSILAQPSAVLCENPDVASFLELGSVRLHDDKKLAVFEIALTRKKKIQRNRVELRNLVARYIDQENNHGVLVIFTGQNEDYRFTFTAKESEFNDDGEFVERQTATKRFTYLLGPHETCTTAARRLSQLAEKQSRVTLADVVDAFSVEKLNKEFFNLYKEHYTTFVNHLLSGTVPHQVFGIPRLADDKEQDKANKPVRDFAKRLLGRLVFLHFIQKKGWLGCPADCFDWTNGERNFVRNLFLSCPDKDKFYSTRLVPLFFEALNRSDRPNSIFAITGTRVPYLNGGLFEHEKLPNDHKLLPVERLDFPATLFEQLLEFFGQYNFTIDENDPDDHEVGIDPEMLGHIFENLLEDNKDKGAFYTPKAIVQYMCQQSLIHYVQQHLGERDELVQLVRFKDAGSATDKTNWVRQNAKRIEELLDRVKICDPAIGSGAFPIGLLQEIYWIKLTLDWTLDPAEAKLKIIQNSIYGVDIDAGAVEIARLRFWLALIVDEEEPHPLPNLDYKIMQGDSLLESFEGIPLDNLQQSKGFKIEVFSKQGQGQMFPGDLLEFTRSQESTARAKEISNLINKYFDVTNPTEKQELHKQIDRFVLDHIDYNLQIQEEKFSDELQLRKADIKRKAGLVKGWKPTKKDEQRLVALEDGLKSIAIKRKKLQKLEENPERPYFLWHLFFQDVFENGGFDIFIANPPYVRQEAIKAKKRDLEGGFGEFFCGTADLYTYFYKLGVDKLKPAGHLCYIAPNKFMRAGYGKNTRTMLATETTPKVVLDFGDLPIFDATTYPSILLVEKTPPQNNTFVAATFTEPSQLRRLEDTIATVGFTMQASALKSSGWNLERSDVLALMEKLRKVGKPLVEYVDGKCFYGIKTGLNEAFVIDEQTRQRLIAEDPKSAEIIKPWLRGRDIYKWRAHWAGLYVLFTRRGTAIDQYPAIKRHLEQFRADLEPKTSAKDKHGRKPGPYKWFEIQDNIAYFEEFEKEKILWPGITSQIIFGLGEKGQFGNDNNQLIVSSDRCLLAILNSRLIRFVLQQICDKVRGGFYRMKMIYVEQLPIISATDNQKTSIIECVQQILDNPFGPDVSRLEAEIDHLVYELYDLTTDEIALVENANVVRSEPPDKKIVLFDHILTSLNERSSYFSLTAVKRALTAADIDLADDTLREYMSEAMATGIVADAGRGWYSRHKMPVSLDPKPVAKVIRAVKKAYPLLDFCCWSTVQFNPFALHLIAQPTIFLYAESDALHSVAENLKENSWDAWADPGKNEVERYIKPGERTVILRPSIQKQPESKDQVAPLEKALVDLKIESSRLHLMDSAEVQGIVDAVLSSGLLQVTALIGYSEVKRERLESAELTH